MHIFIIYNFKSVQIFLLLNLTCLHVIRIDLVPFDPMYDLVLFNTTV